MGRQAISVQTTIKTLEPHGAGALEKSLAETIEYTRERDFQSKQRGQSPNLISSLRFANNLMITSWQCTGSKHAPQPW